MPDLLELPQSSKRETGSPSYTRPPSSFTSGKGVVLKARYPPTIRCGGFNEKPRLPGQSQKVPISGDQQVGLPTFGEVEEWLVVFVPAGQLGFSCHLNYFAIGKVLRQ
jgi:hypothetical protein